MRLRKRDHALGFLASGGIAFLIDAAVLEGLRHYSGLSPLVCRLFSISAAMLAGWQLHRRWTFGHEGWGSWRELAKFLSVGWGSAALNYGCFVSICVLAPGLSALVAMAVSSAVATAYSYLGFRFLVFRPRPDR